MDYGLLLFPFCLLVYSISSAVLDMSYYQRKFSRLNYNSEFFDCENLADVLMAGSEPKGKRTEKNGLRCLAPHTFSRRDRDETELKEVFDRMLDSCIEEGCQWN